MPALDTVNISGVLHDVQGQPAVNLPIRIARVVKSDQEITLAPFVSMTDENGNVDLDVPASSVVYLYANTSRLSANGMAGIPLGVETDDLDINDMTAASVASNGRLNDLLDVIITSPSSGQGLTYNGTSWVNTAIAGNGTVTSVAMSVPSILAVGGSPITSSGTLALTLATQAANIVLAGPVSGGAATPTFRGLVAADIPALAQSGITNLVSDLALKAPLASPTFTGTVTVPTPSNSTDAATKQYVDDNAGGGVSAWADLDFAGSNLTDILTRDYSDLQNIPASFTPSAHASSHQHGGADEIATATAAANAMPKAGAGGTLDSGWIPDLSSVYEAANANIQAHISSTSNPHSVTKSQVGLGSVENTALSTWAGSTNLTTLGALGATLNLNSHDISNVHSVFFESGFGLFGDATPGDTYKLYGFDGSSYQTVATVTNANPPVLNLASNSTIGGVGILGTNGDGSSLTGLLWSQIGSTPTTLSGYGITDAQGLNSNLTALAGLTSAADKLPYFTGSGAASLADFSSFGRSLAAVADEAAFKALVNLEIGTDVQAYSANLAALSTLGTSLQQIRVNAGGTAYEFFTPSASGGLTVGTTTIAGGTDTKSLYNNAGVLGERTVTGTGNAVLSASPTLTGTTLVASITASGVITAANTNSLTNPPLSIGSTNTGFYPRTSTLITGVAGGADQFGFGAGVFRLPNTNPLQWSGANDPWAGGVSGLRPNTNSPPTFEFNNGNSGQWAALLIGRRDSGTTTVTNGLTIGHQSSGTAAAGLGSALLFNVDSSTTPDQQAARIAAIRTNNTHASRASDLVFYTDLTGSFGEGGRFTSGGYFFQKAPNAAPTDGDLANSQISAYLNESLNTLNFRVKYSDGTLKTVSLALT